jgi:hypothetical protein
VQFEDTPLPAAIPGVSSSTPPAQSRPGGANVGANTGGGLLRVVGGQQMNDEDAQRASEAQEAHDKAMAPTTDLGAYIRQRWYVFRNHRNQGNNQINDRLLRAQRMFEGKYDPEKLSQIKKFGGSEVFSRLIAVKARGATSLLRDVYLGADRPWDIEPQPDPPVPPEVQASVVQLCATEAMTNQQAGVPTTEDQVHMRYMSLMHAAQQAARRQAQMQADAAADKIDDMLKAGGFYSALAEFLTDLPIFPFAVMKGPVVRMVPKMSWINGKPLLQNKAQMFWERIDPFHFYWTPGVSDIKDAEIIEVKRLTRADLNDLLGLPGYDQDAVRNALQDYQMGLRDWLDWPDTEAALNEARENPYMNLSHMIDALEYHGNVQGHMLLAQGVPAEQVPDPDRDYAVQSIVVGRWTIKTQINPSPRQRAPYFITSFEKVPGTVIGHGLSDILEDIQEAANATLRSLVNNMAIASGPQVVVNDDVMVTTENGDELYPWKRWHVQNDPMGGTNGQPISFFQPQSNAQELLQVYTALNTMADDISAIPKYTTGESLSGGAGRTASGLSMLMGGAQKVLQTVAANIDNDVLEPLLTAIYDMIMLTDNTGMLSGNEQVQVNGVHVTVQKETERTKRLQFLQITGNPIDQQIVGTLGRARVLRSVSEDLGLPDDIVPDDQQIQQQQQAQNAMQAQALHAGVQQGQHPDQSPHGNTAQKAPPPSPAARAAGAQQGQAKPASHADNAPPVNQFQASPTTTPGQGVPTNGP